MSAPRIDGGAVIVWTTGALMLGGCAGWVLNVIKIAWALGEPATPLLAFRIFGMVFLPIGMILGWV